MQIRPRIILLILVIVAPLALSAVVEANPGTGVVVELSGIVCFSNLETVWELDTSRKKTVFRPDVSGRHVQIIM